MKVSICDDSEQDEVLRLNLKENANKIPAVIYILLISGVGFIIGVLTIGLKQENWLISGDILEQDFIYRIKELSIDKRALFFLCLGKRLRAFFILFLLAFSSVNRFSNVLFFILYGWYVGSIIELFAVRYGWQGIMMYLSLVLPQGILYVLGFVILGCWCWNLENMVAKTVNQKVEKVKKINGISRIIIAFLFVFVGCVLESYISLEIFLLFF